MPFNLFVISFDVSRKARKGAKAQFVLFHAKNAKAQRRNLFCFTQRTQRCKGAICFVSRKERKGAKAQFVLFLAKNAKEQRRIFLFLAKNAKEHFFVSRKERKGSKAQRDLAFIAYLLYFAYPYQLSTLPKPCLNLNLNPA